MKIRLIILLALACVMHLKLHAQDTLAFWKFDEASGSVTKEDVSGTNFTVQTKWPVVEKVTGVQGKAQRSDGYTTFVEGTLLNTFPTDAISISGWLALETYPTSEAAFWSRFDPSTNRGAVVSIDKFGRLTVSVSVNNVVQAATATTSVQHREWAYIVVNIDAANGSLRAYVNGVEVIQKTISNGTIDWPANTAKIYIGRHPKTEMADVFPLNYLNGIFDEIVVSKKLPTASEIVADYNVKNPSVKPDLNTPASRFADDFHRPKYHGIPNANWTNESHGLIYKDGLYHLFFQKNGNGPLLYQQNWGHLTSPDLIRWKEEVVALWPQPGWEQVGIWSGHLVLDDSGTPTIIYTGVDGVKAGIGSAKSTDNFTTWKRNPNNPLIASAPSSYPNKDFRDPYVFKEGSTWFMIVGSGLQSPDVGTVFLYQSTDLGNWTFIGPMFSGDPYAYDAGTFWEMPVFWKFGNKYMLLVNKVPTAGTPARAFYWVGTFNGTTFTPDNEIPKNLEVVNHLLSPSVNYDAQGRVIGIGIIPDELPGSEHYKQGWAHLYSIPRVYTMKGDTLAQSPHPNLDQLRGTLLTYSNLTVQNGGSDYLTGKRGLQLEIKATIQQGTAQKAGFVLEKAADNSELTRIYYDYQTMEVVVDRSLSSTGTSVPKNVRSEYLPLPTGQPIDWHIYVDGSVIEVFINNQFAFGTRVFPANATSDLVDLYASGGNATASGVQLWNLTASALPLTITNFFGVASAGYNKLNVTIAQAVNIKEVQVERSSDGLTFTKIGLLKPNENGFVGNILYNDYTAPNNKNYYRLKIIDLDGSVSYSKIVSLNGVKKNSIKIYPNPASGRVTVDFEQAAPQHRFNLNIYNAAGTLMQQRTIEILNTNIFSLDTASLSNGIYYLKIKGDEGNEVYNERLLIHKK